MEKETDATLFIRLNAARYILGYYNNNQQNLQKNKKNRRI